MNPIDAIAWAGGASALARKFSPPVTRSAVSHWVRDGVVPYRRALELRDMSRGFLRIDKTLYGWQS
jgi:hypothetical protein